MTKTILLADDSVTIQKVIELTFLDQDYEVVSVSKGDDALERLEQMTPDLVVADVHMPGATGYEVSRRSKQLHPEVPVLLLVGTFEPFDEGEVAGSGADAHLKKPFDSQELLQLVERLVSSASSAATPAAATPEAAAQEAAPSPPVSTAPDASVPEAAGSEASASESSAPQATEPAAGAEAESAALVAESPAPGQGAVWGNLDLDADLPSPEEPETVFGDLGEVPASGDEEGSAPFRLMDEGEAFDAPLGEAAVAAEELAPAEAWEEARAAEAVAGFQAEAAAPAESTASQEKVMSEPTSTEASSHEAGGGLLSDEDVDRIARRLLELAGDSVLREVAWEVIPDLAEVVIKNRIQELENQVE